MVTLTTRDPCGVCGFIRKGFSFPMIRINKRSMRSHGTTLTALPGGCTECGAYVGSAPRLRWVLDPESAAEVEACRLRRWPELASERNAA
jgi:hypothetical protein